VHEPQLPAKASSPSASETAAADKLSKATIRNRLSGKIRSELNIEKWPAIWQPSKSKNKPALRTMQRELSGDHGARIISRVEVGYTQLGTLTTEEQKLLYVLIKLWEDDGKPDVQVFISTRGLARLLKKKGWGTNVIHAITKSLRKLRTIPIEWINSYYDQTSGGAVVVDRRPFTILGDLRIVERHQDGAVNSSLGYFKFDDHILRNLQRNFTKPVCIEEFFKLRSEIAQLIYSHIDLMLFDKSRYERRSRELFDDLGLKNPEYEHMYERRRALEKAVRELDGIQLSRGAVKSAAVEKTSDGKDYKVVFIKGPSARPNLQGEDGYEELAAPAVVVNNYSRPKDPLTEQAEDLVRHFHRSVHAVDIQDPQTKEVSQALSLISKHGFEPSKFIVEFAAAKAAQTNYPIQHFGAVLGYASRGMAAFKRPAAPAPWPSPRPLASTTAPVRQLHETGERRLAALSAEQLDLRFEQAKADLFRDQPFLAHTRSSGSHLVGRAVRARLVRDLEAQSMDLLPFDPTLTSRYPWLSGAA
jgi:hypothetical protein